MNKLLPFSNSERLDASLVRTLINICPFSIGSIILSGPIGDLFEIS